MRTTPGWMPRLRWLESRTAVRVVPSHAGGDDVDADVEMTGRETWRARDTERVPVDPCVCAGPQFTPGLVDLVDLQLDRARAIPDDEATYQRRVPGGRPEPVGGESDPRVGRRVQKSARANGAVAARDSGRETRGGDGCYCRAVLKGLGDADHAVLEFERAVDRAQPEQMPGGDRDAGTYRVDPVAAGGRCDDLVADEWSGHDVLLRRVSGDVK